MFPTPRQGYLLTMPIENPWGNKSNGGIDISPVIAAAPGTWNQVIASWEGSPYLEGSFVYYPKQVAEPVVMAERTISLVHESVVKMTMPRDTFKPTFLSVSTEEFMSALAEARAKRDAPALAIAQ